jgi:hypothetical protein
MTDEEEDYEHYRAMFKNSLMWSVALVAIFGVIAWMV